MKFQYVENINKFFTQLMKTHNIPKKNSQLHKQQPYFFYYVRGNSTQVFGNFCIQMFTKNKKLLIFIGVLSKDNKINNKISHTYLYKITKLMYAFFISSYDERKMIQYYKIKIQQKYSNFMNKIGAVSLILATI